MTALHLDRLTWTEVKSEIMEKVFDGIQNLDENGVLGDPPATAAAGEQYFEDIINISTINFNYPFKFISYSAIKFSNISVSD